MQNDKYVQVSFKASASCVKATNIIAENAEQIFFCGYKLSEVIEKDLFRRLSSYAESGFCYELSAIAMFLLKDFPLSQLQHGRAFLGEEAGNHAIVEFNFYHEDFVLDLMWAGLRPIPAKVYKSAVGFCDINFRANYRTFWDDRNARLIYHYMCTRELSHLFGELAYFRPFDQDKTMIFLNQKGRELYDHLSNIGVGYHLVPRPTLSGNIIDQQLIDELMLDDSDAKSLPPLPRQEEPA